MKLGAENRNKLIAAVSLGVIALLALIYAFSDFLSSPSTSAAAPTPTITNEPSVAAKPQRAAKAGSKTGKRESVNNLDPSLRFDLLKGTEDTKYEGAGRNIFRVFVEPPPRTVAPVVTSQPTVAQTAPQVVPPPPINLKFYGFATPAGGVKRIFLAKEEDVFIAKEGDIVDRRYKVVRIAPNSVEILDVLSNNRQSIPLIQG